MLIAKGDDHERWFRRWPREPEVRLKLICFPYGGGSPDAYERWSDQLPDTIEVMALRLPGHDSRLREAHYRDWAPLLDDLEEVLSPIRDQPFAFFGHSFGARIAYELAARSQARGLAMPQQLFVSGCRCPHQANRRPLMHQLPSPDFRAQVLAENEHIAKMEYASDAVKLFEPLLRAEIGLSERWGGLNKPRLAVPITALAGEHDPIDPPEKMLEWGSYTEREFSFFTFSGDHFFVHSHEGLVLEHVAWKLRHASADTPQRPREEASA
ncbi:MAG: alpha/beta fold hydrolase [Deltaproteobacteria bacterium]|nr:alpha/beta fold hydrolase [Deltaproteobacteria bacterium]